MIKAIIFDLNGVFIQSPKLSDRFRENYGVRNEIFLPALKEIMAKSRLPNAGDSYQYWLPFLKTWNIDLIREEFFNFWFTGEKEVPELIAFARELKSKGLKLFILSNNFAERAAYYKEHFGFLTEIFDKIYYSWETGFVKPDTKAFALLIKENNLAPAECVYFDDTKDNIEVARRFGLKAYLFTNLEEMKTALNS